MLWFSAHHTLNQVSGFKIEQRCGQLAGTQRTLSRGVMGGAVTQGCTVEVCMQHPSSPFTQSMEEVLRPPWDWQLWAEGAGIVTAILSSWSHHWNNVFLRRRQRIWPTYQLTVWDTHTHTDTQTLPVALCNNNHRSVIALKCHQWLIVWWRQSVRERGR